MLESNGGMVEDVSHRIKAGWVSGGKHLASSLTIRSLKSYKVSSIGRQSDLRYNMEQNVDALKDNTYNK